MPEVLLMSLGVVLIGLALLGRRLCGAGLARATEAPGAME